MPPKRGKRGKRSKLLHQAMPGLTVDTSPKTNTQTSKYPNSRSISPVHPPYSPITPTLAAARLATSSDNAPANPPPQRQTYTHSQAPQTGIPQPAPVPLKFDENPDALALKSAISILQIQARNATRDIMDLQRMKDRAVADPEGFARALMEGHVASTSDPLFNPTAGSLDDGDDEEYAEEGARMDTDAQGSKEREIKWGKLPAPQNVVRCPPINWNQYAVVGESLDKLHKDQQSRPTEGMPQRLGADGNLLYGGDGTRRSSEIGVAAPFQPGRDRIEKMGTNKDGKR